MNSAFDCMHKANALRRFPFPALVLAAFLFSVSSAARAQVVYSGDEGGAVITVGALGTGEALQYGSRRMIGLTGVADLDTHRRFGLEAEGRWLEWHQTTDVHLETYSIGGRYHFDVGRRFEPYAKGLIGVGYFNYPYNLATGSYMVITAGAGLDMRLTRHIYLRAADFEYQDWPQFTYGAMTTASVSSGIKIRVF